MVGGRRVEVDVGVDPGLLLHHRLDPARRLVPAGVARPFAELLRHPPQVGRARVLGAVHAVAETGHLHLAGEHAAHRPLDARVVGVLADRQQHPHHLGVGSAVQRALEGADPGHHGRVHVAERGRGDPRGEGRCVQLVVRVQDERDVERPRRERRRTVPGEQQQEVRRVTERRIGIERAAAGVQPAPRRHQAADLRGQPHRLPAGGGRRRVVRLGIRVREGRHQRAQRVHGAGGRQAAQQPQRRFRQPAGRGEVRPQVAQLRARRESAAPEQVAHLLETGLPRQIVDVVAGVGQHAPRAVDVADRGRGGHDPLQPRPGLPSRGRHRAPPSAAPAGPRSCRGRRSTRRGRVTARLLRPPRPDRPRPAPPRSAAPATRSPRRRTPPGTAPAPAPRRRSPPRARSRRRR